MRGDRLADLRKDKGLTQQDLANELNISYHTISSYETNRSNPDDEMKIKIARIFDVTLDYLLGLIDEQVSFRRDNPVDLTEEGLIRAISEKHRELGEYIELLREVHKSKE
ncbi:MAG: XRE family transcriptional regulator [Clostridiales bacterium]|uniref:helix-turn-helix domain-containing protein n=1 Tax=Provencibacterium massiliense TaxID=1841868 RepID=UPI0009A845B7|nr:helix-turn-helix transcriptional regulator [Provencibacterium massiliense]PWM36758.1 MAG: XRE family transcriptional regulator [Clostridiales bacterium]RGB63653.1 XRE family transcriptional regulator [Harryflintia acetispora]